MFTPSIVTLNTEAWVNMPISVSETYQVLLTKNLAINLSLTQSSSPFVWELSCSRPFPWCNLEANSCGSCQHWLEMHQYIIQSYNWNLGTTAILTNGIKWICYTVLLILAWWTCLLSKARTHALYLKSWCSVHTQSQAVWSTSKFRHSITALSLSCRLRPY